MSKGEKQSGPESLAIAEAIGRVTFLEIMRDRVLYNIILCSALMFGVGFLASRLATLMQGRVLLDFGLSVTSLSCLAVAVLSGGALIGRELERRTFSVALSRPITTWQFAIGKFCGLAAVVTVNWLLLIAAFLLVMFVSEGTAMFSSFSATLFWALILALFQGFLAGALAIFFSSFSTTSLSIIFTVGLLLIGNNISQLRWLAAKDNPPIIAYGLKGIAALFPNFEYFNLGTKVTYALPVKWYFVFGCLLYAVVWIVLAIAGSGFFLRKRES
jgi:Cu-processing system permease protein